MKKEGSVVLKVCCVVVAAYSHGQESLGSYSSQAASESKRASEWAACNNIKEHPGCHAMRWLGSLSVGTWPHTTKRNKLLQHTLDFMLVAALIWKRPATALGILLLKDSQKPHTPEWKLEDLLIQGQKSTGFYWLVEIFFYFIELKMKLLDIYILRFCKPEGYYFSQETYRASNLKSR